MEFEDCIIQLSSVQLSCILAELGNVYLCIPLLQGFLNLVPSSVYGSDLLKFLAKSGAKDPKSVAKDLVASKFLVSQSGPAQFQPSALYSLVHIKGEEALNTKKMAVCVKKSAEQVTEEIRFCEVIINFSILKWIFIQGHHEPDLYQVPEC